MCDFGSTEAASLAKDKMRCKFLRDTTAPLLEQQREVVMRKPPTNRDLADFTLPNEANDRPWKICEIMDTFS
jgi:hypothetical protein